MTDYKDLPPTQTRAEELFSTHQRLVGDRMMLGWKDCALCYGTGRCVDHTLPGAGRYGIEKCPTCEMRYLQEILHAVEGLWEDDSQERSDQHHMEGG